MDRGAYVMVGGEFAQNCLVVQGDGGGVVDVFEVVGCGVNGDCLVVLTVKEMRRIVRENAGMTVGTCVWWTLEKREGIKWAMLWVWIARKNLEKK